MVKVVLPDLGENIEKATVTYWHVKIGAPVKEGDDLVEMATDKATFNVPSPCSGTITEIVAQEGDVVDVGGVLAVLEEN